MVECRRREEIARAEIVRFRCRRQAIEELLPAIWNRPSLDRADHAPALTRVRAGAYRGTTAISPFAKRRQ
jgi:hypothetical protein